jgi:hypothetical protein
MGTYQHMDPQRMTTAISLYYRLTAGIEEIMYFGTRVELRI